MKPSTAIFRAVGLVLLTLAATARGAAAQETPPVAGAPLTLDQVIERAQREGHGTLAAWHTLEAARLRYSAFGANLLPRVSLSGNAPSYNKSISPVIQPDGATVFIPRGEMSSSVLLISGTASGITAPATLCSSARRSW